MIKTSLWHTQQSHAIPITNNNFIVHYWIRKMTILNSKYVTLVLRWQGEDKDKTRMIFCDRIDWLWGKEVGYLQSVFFFLFRVFNQHVSALKALIKNNGFLSPAIWSHKWSEQVSWFELRAGPSCQYQVDKSLSTVWFSLKVWDLWAEKWTQQTI